mmetsp:Transcript_14137/g.34274  ORF Transcript_14137/g.34274 Transcript_14137/m.34274 type:complete len:141 (+) Transcript_14137:368-790(+)
MIGSTNGSVTTMGVMAIITKDIVMKRIVMEEILKEEMIATSTMSEDLPEHLTVNENDGTILLLMVTEEAQLVIVEETATLRHLVDRLTAVIRAVVRDRDRDRDQGPIRETTVETGREADLTHRHLVLSHHLLFPAMTTNF